MFANLLFNLRAAGIRVGLGEWMAFLEGLRKGLVVDLDGLYGFGRAVLLQTEAQYDAWDLAFQATFAGVELPQDLSSKLAEWLNSPVAADGEIVQVDKTPEELWEEFKKRLAEQKERHDGGNRWIGTGGTSPYGNSGRASTGVRVGGQSGGGRAAVRLAEERRWADYRTDRRLERRDFEAALKQLRSLAREGQLELDLDRTIRKTSDNAGEIDLVYTRKRQNRVHLVLLLDTGGSMDPHTKLVEQLFTAAKEAKGFKSFKAWQFHNAPTGWLYEDYATWSRKRIDEVMRDWTPQHRLVWVGDASMASWELFGSSSYPFQEGTSMSGLDWMRRIAARCPRGVWLNPDEPKYWDHPTVKAIGGVYPMFPLTLSGLRDAVRKLRAAQA